MPSFLDDKRLRELERAVEPASQQKDKSRAAATEAARKLIAQEEAKRQADEARRAAEEKLRQTEARTEEKRLTKQLRRETEAAKSTAPAPTADPAADRPPFIYAGNAGLAGAKAGKTIDALKPCNAKPIGTKPLAAGRMFLSVDQPCRAGERLVVRYGHFDVVRILDAAGRTDIEVDLFLGKDQPLELEFADGNREAVAITTVDLERVAKFAVIWKGPINLDLHAFEYAAARGERGHVWAGAPASAEQAIQAAALAQRGAGFLSSRDTGRGEGHNIEVYTFWMSPGQDTGQINMALDYETRGSKPGASHCGTGPAASVAFEIVMRRPTGQVVRESGLMQAARCGEPLSDLARYRRDVLPELSFH